VQIDVKFIAPLAATAGAAPPARTRPKYYQFTAIDDCTRLRVLRLYPALNQKTAIQFVDYVLQRLPFRVEVIQTDIQAGCAALRLLVGRWVRIDAVRRLLVVVADRSEHAVCVTSCLLSTGGRGAAEEWRVLQNPVTGCWPDPC
jgi:hypothetical protein